MRKILRLYQNECIKATRRVSIFVIAILMVVGILGGSGVMKLIYVLGTTYGDELFSSTEGWSEYYSEMYDEYKSIVEEEKEDLSSMSEEDEDLYDAVDSYWYALSEYYYYGKCVSLTEEQSDTYRDEAANLRGGALANAVLMEEFPSLAVRYLDEADTDAEEQRRLANAYETAIDGTYADYIALQIDLVDKEESVSEEEKAIEREYYQLLLKGNPEGSAYAFELESLADTVSAKRTQLLQGVKYSGNIPLPLTEKERETLENDIAIALYQIENGMIAGEDDAGKGYFADLTYQLTYGAGAWLVLIAAILLAGSAVSQEISTGSIKALIISPTRRWKILTAKLACIVSISGAMMLLVYLLSGLGVTIFFGAEHLPTYVTASGGVAREIPAMLFGLAKAGLDYVTVLVFLLFALMLSVTTRNTAFATVFSMAVYSIGGGISSILALFSGEWVKFIPLIHTDLSSRVFPMQGGFAVAIEELMSNMPSVTFSVVYLAVAAVLMLVTMYDSFNRRDI